MSYLPNSVLALIASRHIAADFPGLSPQTMRYMAGLHRERGELLSAAQYEDMAEDREEVDVGVVQGG